MKFRSARKCQDKKNGEKVRQNQCIVLQKKISETSYSKDYMME